MKSKRIEGLILQLQMHGRLFKNVIDGIEETKTSTLIHPNSVHLDWLIGHIIAVRSGMGITLGISYNAPEWMAYFAKGKGMQNVEYPKIHEYIKTWDELEDKIMNRLLDITDDELDKKLEAFPVELFSNTILEALYFFAHHEAYHIGQLGMSRKVFGYKAMSYKPI